MPSQFDNTYHAVFRKPTFDGHMDKKIYQMTKEADEIFEVRPAPIPTPEMEVEYIDWLQNDLKSDPWLTHRFRKYTCNPKRIPWKNTRQIKRQYQYTFTVNWVVGSLLSWPIAAMIGRSWKTNATGVPMVRLNRWVHDFPQPEPGRSSRLVFRYYSMISAALMGLAFAKYFTDCTPRSQNEWYNRPDLKPFAAMVKTPEGESIINKTMKEAQYVPESSFSWKRTPLYRFFMGRDADYTIKENPYQTAHPDDVWDSRKGHYTTYSNNFSAHHQ